MKKGWTTSRDVSNVTPFLRWAGSKRAAIPVLRQFVPKEFKKYIEPFAGSACLFFYVQPKRAVLADLNAELIDTYAAIKDTPGYVGRSLADLPFGREAYYRIRQNSGNICSPIQRAVSVVR